MKHFKNLKIFLLLFIFLIFSFGIYFFNQSFVPENSSGEENSKQFIKIKDKILKIEVVNSPAERSLGLSGRENLAEDTGMLFVFEKPERYGFWMKKMNFPIDIFWISEDFEIVSIKKGADPDSYPEIFIPETEARYVLEMISGFSEENNILVGEKVEFLPVNTP